MRACPSGLPWCKAVFQSPRECLLSSIKGVPVYALESGNKVKEFEAPPMSEEIIFVDGKLLTMCESASGKYFFGNLTGGRWCYATDASKLG